jgi:mRNA-degrading endonuclease RelE of RelBE toxin-antitoxin system
VSKKKLTAVVFPVPLKKSLRKKPPEIQAKLLRCLTQLREDPSHPGLHVHAVRSRGKDNILEARIDKKNRVTFYWDKGDIVIENHCHHDILEGRG